MFYLMRVLVACESSSVVAQAFYELGHDAYSCDLLPTSHPTFPNHIIDDAVYIAYSTIWDLIISHPPCTYLANSGIHHNKDNPYRQAQTEQAIKFAVTLWNAPTRFKALENPRSILARHLGRAHYTYQPWWFGDPISKLTCLWLSGLHPPRQTHFAPPRVFLNRDPVTGHDNTPANSQRATIRSRTPIGVAQAFARAWGDL